MNNKDIAVSVVIPTYKRPDTLDRAIKSVLNQTYPNVEVIVVDDNDPDTEGRKLTEEKMAQFINEPRVRYIKHEHNKNGSAARNTGARAANGEYVAFLDDDDEYLPRKIETQLKALEGREEEWACCYSRYATRKAGGKAVENNEHREGNLYLEALMREFHIASGSNLLVNKSAFFDLNGFDESFIRNQDIEFLTRLLKKYKIAYAPYCGLIVNIHYNHSYFDEEDITQQYLKRFAHFVNDLSPEEQVLFYRRINQQRFFYFFRNKHDFKRCRQMLRQKEVSFHDAAFYTLKKMWIYIKRPFRDKNYTNNM